MLGKTASIGSDAFGMDAAECAAVVTYGVGMQLPAPNATIIGRRDFSERVALFRIRHDDGDIPAFEPGQFVQIGLALETPARDGSGAMVQRLQKRSYSIASAAHDKHAVELCLAHVFEGRFTPELWKLREGGRIWLDPRALGTFTLDRVPPERDLVLVATGTGVAPYVSMLRTHAEDPRWRRIAIVHGVRDTLDLCFREELEAHAKRDPRMFYVPLVSRPAEHPAWSGLTGHVQVALDPRIFGELTGIPLDPATAHAFLCGNPAMIADVRVQLEARGFVADTAKQNGGLRLERYW